VCGRTACTVRWGAGGDQRQSATAVRRPAPPAYPTQPRCGSVVTGSDISINASLDVGVQLSLERLGADPADPSDRVSSAATSTSVVDGYSVDQC
jgi:hypothetical protein